MAQTISASGSTFRDQHGRHVILRGVNFGGDCKLPFPGGATHVPTDFSDHRDVTFVGRPAPLDEIDTHLARLRHWGFNCLRLLTTWEAVEHRGPGEHDQEYLDYLAAICRRAGHHGLNVFIDFHQDVWSRMSGGDGAPGWTWEAAGIDFTKFDAADAAIVMQHRYDPSVGGEQDSYPRMIWGSNYRMPANGLIWSLFWGGETFAPAHRVDGVNVGRYLQDHYLGAMRAVAERVADVDCVIGFDSLNEPGSGWIGQALDENRGLFRGPAWSPLDGMAAASGVSRAVPLVGGGTKMMNAAGVSIWLPGHEDPFRAAGAWDFDTNGQPVALRRDFFQVAGGRPVDLDQDLMLPFFHRAAGTIRSVRDEWLLFVEADPFSPTQHGLPGPLPERTVNASHWYDLATLVTKRFDVERHMDLQGQRPLSGARDIEQSYVDGLAKLVAKADGVEGGAPSLVGEFGIPYDMNGADAYRRWSQGERSAALWDQQVIALDLMYNALDRLLLSSAHWNYTVSNRNDVMVGDGWNQEDLSIWSSDQAEGPGLGAGGRAVEGFCRPYVRAAQGRLVTQSFDRASGAFEATIDVDRGIEEPTELFVPDIHYASGFAIEAAGGTVRREGDVVRVDATSDEVRIRIARASRQA